jgi:hypothetical protein
LTIKLWPRRRKEERIWVAEDEEPSFMLGLGLENEGRMKEEPSGEAKDQRPE